LPNFIYAFPMSTANLHSSQWRHSAFVTSALICSVRHGHGLKYFCTVDVVSVEFYVGFLTCSPSLRVNRRLTTNHMRPKCYLEFFWRNML